MIRAAFIFMGSGSTPSEHHASIQTPSVHLNVFGVSKIQEALILVQTLVVNGITSIELCPAFTDEETKLIKNTVLGKAKVGKVSFEPTPDNSQTSLEFNVLSQILLAGLKKADELSEEISICILDAAGHEQISYRMPNAIIISIELAKKKATSSILMKLATQELHALTKPGAPLYQLEAISRGQIVTFAGGIPIFNKDGKLVGALGVSGALDPNNDQKIAETLLCAYTNYLLHS